MNAARRLAAVACAVIAALTLGGCSDAPAITTTTTAPQPALSGFVVDATVRPVNATVEIASLNLTAKADSTGLYAFATVPSNQSLVVTASAWGFVVQSKTITLSGRPVRLNFTLEPIDIRVPSREVITTKLFLACQGVLVLGETAEDLQCGAIDPQDQDTWEFAVGPDLAGVVVEAFWEPATEAARNLNLSLHTVGFGDSDQQLAAVQGPSPLKAQIGQAQSQTYYQAGGRVQALLAAGTVGDADESGAGAAFVFEQEVQVIATLFYIDPPPATYTAAE